jgi:hypothetical protein
MKGRESKQAEQKKVSQDPELTTLAATGAQSVNGFNIEMGSQ